MRFGERWNHFFQFLSWRSCDGGPARPLGLDFPVEGDEGGPHVGEAVGVLFGEVGGFFGVFGKVVRGPLVAGRFC